MRESRKLAIRTACRIIERNLNVNIAGEDEDALTAQAVHHVGQVAFDNFVDEIELALKEYAYDLTEGKK
jgi:hypothetical protein